LITKTGKVRRFIFPLNSSPVMLIETCHTQTIHLPYEEWAEDYIARIKGVLDGARAEHTQAVNSALRSSYMDRKKTGNRTGL
jgi:hypothetical protein